MVDDAVELRLYYGRCADNHVRECLLRLDERERTPILLYYLEGYDIGQIASILRIPQGTVKSRLNRGRRQLKSICREEVFEA